MTTFLMLCLIAIVAILPVAPGFASPTDEATGGWIGEVPCVLTHVGDPSLDADVPFSCSSGTWWDGTWTGHTIYTVAGEFNIATNTTDATIDETLIGVAPAGTLHLAGTLHIDGATNMVVVHERVVDGTDDFEGSHGEVTFEGVQVSGIAGHGGYHGTWMRE